jgi:hypothetical protein
VKLEHSDSVHVRGRIEVLEHDAETGVLLSRYCGPNIVTNVGETLIAERLRGNTAVTGVSLYALGTDSTPPVAGNTALLGEAYRDVLLQTRVSAGDLIMTIQLGATQGNGFTYQEGGAFNEEGTMLCRAIFAAKIKNSAKKLTIIHTVTFTAS